MNAAKKCPMGHFLFAKYYRMCEYYITLSVLGLFDALCGGGTVESNSFTDHCSFNLHTSWRGGIVAERLFQQGFQKQKGHPILFQPMDDQKRVK